MESANNQVLDHATQVPAHDLKYNGDPDATFEISPPSAAGPQQAAGQAPRVSRVDESVGPLFAPSTAFERHAPRNQPDREIDPSRHTNATPVPRQRPTYQQEDWSLYNAAGQASEEMVLLMLVDAFDAINRNLLESNKLDNPAEFDESMASPDNSVNHEEASATDASSKRKKKRKRKAGRASGVGRPAFPFRDLILGCGVRSLLNKSGRLADSHVRDLRDKNLLLCDAKWPRPNVISDAMRDRLSARAVKAMIDLTVAQVVAIEDHVLIDRCVYGAPNSKYMIVFRGGEFRQVQLAANVNLDLAVGAKTGLRLAAMVTPQGIHESRTLVPLLELVRRRLPQPLVSADGAYGSEGNRAYVERDLGGTLFVPFRDDAKLHGDEPWDSQLTEYRRRTQEWERAFCQRSKIESANSADKRVNRPKVRSRHFMAQQSELLMRQLIHNLRILVLLHFRDRLPISFLRDRTRYRLAELKSMLMPLDE